MYGNKVNAFKTIDLVATEFGTTAELAPDIEIEDGVIWVYSTPMEMSLAAERTRVNLRGDIQAAFVTHLSIPQSVSLVRGPAPYRS